MIRLLPSLLLTALPAVAEPCLAQGPWDQALSCHFIESCAEGLPCAEADLVGQFVWRDVPDGVRAFPMGPAAFTQPSQDHDWCGTFMKVDGWIKAELGESLGPFKGMLFIGTEGQARMVQVNMADPKVTTLRGHCEVTG